MASPWNVNRLLVLLGAVSLFLAMLVFSGGDLIGRAPEFAPAVPGLIAAIALAIVAPAWLYLTAGILLSLLPLMVLVLFGGSASLLQPAGGAEAQSVQLLVAALVFSLTGGIAGFVQTRRGQSAPIRDVARTPQGLACLVVAAMVLGMFVTSGLAGDQLRGAVADGGTTNIRPDVTVNVATKEFVFSPKEIRVPADQIVALVVTNEDAATHTLTFEADGETIDALLPGGGSTTILLRFDEAQTIPFWCKPHSGGASDDGTGMVGTLIVE